jgi:hypothetical protein
VRFDRPAWVLLLLLLLLLQNFRRLFAALG